MKQFILILTISLFFSSCKKEPISADISRELVALESARRVYNTRVLNNTPNYSGEILWAQIMVVGMHEYFINQFGDSELLPFLLRAK